MKNILLPFIFVLLLAPINKIAAQDIPFTKEHFPSRQKELRAALENIREGDRLYKNWMLPEARPYYQKANDFNPNNAEINYKLACCLYDSYQKTAALQHFEKAHSLSPHVFGDVLFWIAKLYQENEDFAGAIQKYKAYQGSSSETIAKDLPEIERRIKQCELGIELMKKPARVFIDNIGQTVNSEYPEYGPIVNADESVLFFTSRRSNTTGGKVAPEDGKYYEDIYYSVRTHGAWCAPINPGPPMNTNIHNATAGLSPDGQVLFLYYGDRGGDIYECFALGNGWSKPTPLNNNINSKFHESSTSLAPNGKKIYFVSDRPGGFGVRDIYTSELDESGKWGKASILPATVNTPYDEEAVFAHPDGKTLYFSSNGHNTIGGFDIFKTNFENGQWTTPENLGYPINTGGDDIFFSMSASGRHAYYSSAKKGGLGDQDIYIITFLGDEKPMVNNSENNLLSWKTKPTTEAVEEQTAALNNISMTLLKGRVLDIATQQPVAAKIILTDLEKNIEQASFTSNTASGKYLIALPSGKNYGITVTAENYLFHSENFNILEVLGYHEIEKDILLKKIEVGSSIVLKNIFFAFDKATLRPESKNELNRLANLLNEAPSLEIEISGHTDNTGNAQYNKNLSEKRAKAVVDYLIQTGIKAERLSYTGFGFDQPIAPNDTEENKQLNRRTEFTIIKN